MDSLLAFAYEHLRHVVCGLLLVARLGDIGTTWLATPTLALEANPVARKLGWWFALATVLICLLPYYSLPFSLVALMLSLLVSASNASKVWIVRGIGEREYAALLRDVARRTRRVHALASVLGASGFIALAGLTVLLFYPDVAEWGFWLGAGILSYACAIAFHGTAFVLRVFREASREQPAPDI